MRKSAFTLKQRLSLEACTNCGQCLDVCPAVAASGDASLSAQLRMRGLKTLLRRTSFPAQLWEKCRSLAGLSGGNSLPEAVKDFGTSVFRCSLCGDCQEVCPAHLPLKDIWLSLRRELSRTENAPQKVRAIKENIENSHNVFDEENDERGDWVEDMRKPPRDGYQKEQSEIVFFTGCVGAYFPLAQKIPMAFAEILDAAAVDFSIMAGDEWCCGFPLVGSGQSELLPAVMEHNIAAVREHGAKTVVFTCPSCFSVWQEFYPKEFELLHASQLTSKLVLAGKLPLGRLDMTVTYHDPCDLGRGSRVFDEPREVLNHIPGLKFIEMEHKREHCLCCGGGGNLEMIDPDLSAKMSQRKVEEAVATGAQAVVTNCQQCVRTMTTYVRRNKIPLEVLDLSQLISRSLVVGKKG